MSDLPMSECLFQRVALVGIGLIGSSLAHVIRANGIARHVAISTRSPDTLCRAEELGLGQSYHLSPTDAVQDADLVIICTPVGACEAVARAIGPSLKAGAIVSDVGSVKASIVSQIQPHLPDHVAFVPAHPVAGTEQSGPDAGFAGLFQNRWCILTPVPGVKAQDVDRMTLFWQACGSNVDVMTPEHHDLVLAITSHVPHLIAYSIVGTAADLEQVTRGEVMKYSAGGFRDFTRIAASDPTMWRDVFLHNKEGVLEVLGRFTEDLIALQRAVRWGDGDQLFDLFTRTRAIRRGIIEAGQDAAEPDFGRQLAHESKNDPKAETG